MFDIQQLTTNQKKLRRRILELALQHHHSHISSCLCAVDIIDRVHRFKKSKDIFVLSNGHAAIAYYVVLEKYGFLKRKDIDALFIHPDRDIRHGIHVSTGSLGQGLPIGVGMAFADRENHVYCLFSDGECAEGSIWEGLRIASENMLTNITFVISANGFGAYREVAITPIKKQLRALGYEVISISGHDEKILGTTLQKAKKVLKPTVIIAHTCISQFPFLVGQAAHYHKMSADDCESALNLLK